MLVRHLVVLDYVFYNEGHIVGVFTERSEGSGAREIKNQSRSHEISLGTIQSYEAVATCIPFRNEPPLLSTHDVFHRELLHIEDLTRNSRFRRTTIHLLHHV